MDKPKDFLRRKVEVEEADKIRVHGPGAERLHNPEGSVFLAGVPGSGRGELGELLAARLGLPFCFYKEWSEEAGRAVVCLDEEDLARDGAVQRVRAAGTVFYLMSGIPAVTARLLQNDPGQDPETLARNTTRRFFAAEPVFMSALHFLLQGFRPARDLAEDVLEKLSL